MPLLPFLPTLPLPLLPLPLPTLPLPLLPLRYWLVLAGEGRGRGISCCLVRQGHDEGGELDDGAGGQL